MRTLKTYGPPGTGKTTRLLQLLEAELKHLSSRRLAFLTFTRSARLEALSRSKRSEEDFPYCRTIHAICYRRLGMDRSRMIQPKMLKAWGEKIGMELSGYVPDPFAEDIYGESKQPTMGDQLLRLNHLGRHRGVGLKSMMIDAPPELSWEEAVWFTEAYRTWKDKEGLLDFTDLLVHYLKQGDPLPVEALFVDEAQDLSRLQWQVINRLAGACQRLYLAGDDDQAIFTWAGASAELFNSYPADKTEVLEQSYRCPASVMQVAVSIATRIESRVAKTIRSREAQGSVDYAGYLNAQDLRGPSVFVLYRHHHRGKKLAKELEDLTIPFGGHGSPLDDPYLAASLRTIQAWRQGEHAPVQDLSVFLRQVKPEYLKVREAKVPLLVSDTLRNVSDIDKPFDLFRMMPKRFWLQRVVELHGWNKLFKPAVILQSIHKAKGQEANAVIVDTELSRKSWEAFQQNPDDEHRVFYVAVTRARERLVILNDGAMRYEL